jgi:hypothetical protein
MMDSVVTCDQQPDQILYAIRLTLLAKSSKAYHLPHFVSLEFSHGLYQLKIKKPALSLREVMEDEEFLQDHGHMVIKGLLETLRELRNVNATFHNLTPGSVYINSSGNRLVVTDLFAVAFKGMRILDMERGSMPYINQDLQEHELTSFHNQERTMWSVGVIILELFVGTELVNCMRTNEDVVELLDYLSGQFGARIYHLLKGLLFDVRYSIVQDILDDGVLANPERVAKSLKDVQRKRKDSKFLQDMLGERRDGGRSISEEPLSIIGQTSA